jgi:hypothetical protein
MNPSANQEESREAGIPPRLPVSDQPPTAVASEQKATTSINIALLVGALAMMAISLCTVVGVLLWERIRPIDTAAPPPANQQEPQSPALVGGDVNPPTLGPPASPGAPSKEITDAFAAGDELGR